MEKSKRFATLFLAVCLVLSLAVPAVWAEEDTGARAYSFGTGASKYDAVGEGGGVYSGYTKHTANVALQINDQVKYLNQSAVTTNANSKVYSYHTYIEAKYTSSYFQESDIAAKHWIAFEFSGVKAGIYDMAIRGDSGSGGIFNVYVVTPDTYANALGSITLGSTTVLDSAQNTQILNALAAGSLNAANAQINFGSGDKDGYRSIGNVTFENEGSYVVVFQIDEKGKGYNFASNGFTLTPVLATVDGVGYTDATAATDAIGNAAEDAVVKITKNLKLTSDLTTAAAITVDKGAVLDLNGNTLTANVAGTGTVTDSSVGSTGKIVGKSAVQNVGENEIALYDETTATTRIVNYTLTPNGTASASDYEVIEKDGAVSAVKFWYTFKFENAEAYKMIAEADKNAGFGVGATLTFNGNPVPVTLQAGTIAGWAGEMAKDPNAGFAFYVAVTGFENLDANVTGNLDVKLTVSGSAGTAESAVVSYTIG